jgi:hypothetical protein
MKYDFLQECSGSNRKYDFLRKYHNILVAWIMASCPVEMFYYLEYLIKNGGEVVTVVVESVTNRVTPVLSSKKLEWSNSKIHHLPLKNILNVRLKCIRLKVLFGPLVTVKILYFRWCTSSVHFLTCCVEDDFIYLPNISPNHKNSYRISFIT